MTLPAEHNLSSRAYMAATHSFETLDPLLVLFLYRLWLTDNRSRSNGSLLHFFRMYVSCRLQLLLSANILQAHIRPWEITVPRRALYCSQVHTPITARQSISKKLLYSTGGWRTIGHNVTRTIPAPLGYPSTNSPASSHGGTSEETFEIQTGARAWLVRSVFSGVPCQEYF